MRIGKLRHQVEIQEFTIIEDEIGVGTQEWITTSTVWASVEPLKGREYWAAAMVQAETTVKVTIRYLPGITPDHRLKFRGRIYDIQSIINTEERNQELELMCIAKDE